MRIKLFMIALLSIFMMSCSDQVDLPTDTQEETQASKSYLDRASESNTLANKINESIASISRTGESTYPEDFGGLYIDSDGYLVILTTGDFTNSRSAISTVISDSELVRYKACKYSYQDLLNATYEIDQALSTASKKIADNFVGYALMTEDNSVMVMLEDISDAAITDFRQSVYDHPCLTFVKGERINLHASLTLGSEAIIKSISDNKFYAGSYGFRAKKNSGSKRTGLVTSGHLAAVGDPVYSGRTEAVQIGSCVKSQLKGSVDASFLAITDTNYTLSNTIGTTSKTLSASTVNPSVGFPVTLCAKSCLSGSSGTVKSIVGKHVASNGNTLTNICEATYTSINGDSGGLVYGVDAKLNKAAGINIGAATINGSNMGIFCKASTVLTDLGLSMY